MVDHHRQEALFTITPVRTPDQVKEAVTLFRAYADSLGFDLGFQNFDAEMAGMPGKYSPPTGELLLARSNDDGQAILGCVGLRPLPSPSPSSSSSSSADAHADADANINNAHTHTHTHTHTSTSTGAFTTQICEMKRLYVTPSGRGMGVGKALAAEIIAVARRLGYSEMRLDTLSSMVAALAMYRALGFEEIPAYYDTPLEGTHFLSLALETT
ncbi:hypothetical protein PV08_07999 [Exophiala spinifera]|uniref:N-acetyltransferase domain-containing protein n=1 Tax=Exophiala spinifera TaxID=91928 RepID=A0A0D1ZIW7_9EURO|nr:uncharacterized protein PV08_07999 [Exophiala spinifera]KIW12812.1 hypothetical protein PV08_07999 [Exophiala spinifera]